MGSLSNLFISQSYISLIHLGSNNTASSTPTQLEDGLGNGVGVSVSTNGNLYVSGNVYATNLTGSVIDSSSFVTTASFNAYTQSNDSKVNSLIAATASYVTSAITASSLITASVSQSTITFTKGNGTQFSITVADVSGSAGNFVTTSSFNSYTASQDFKNTTFATTSSLSDLSASIYQTDSTQSNNISALSSSNAFAHSTFATTGSNTFVGNQIVSGAITASGNISSSGNIYAANLTGSTIFTGSFVTTSSFNSYTASQDFLNTTFATTSSVNSLSASLYFTDTTQSVNIASNSSSIGLLQTFSGSQYKNDSSSFDSRIDSLEIASGGFVTTSSFNSYTSSQDFKNTTFATTGSNNFIGNQRITGSLLVTGSTILKNLSTTGTPLIISSSNTTDYYAAKLIGGGIYISSSDYGTSAVVGTDLLGTYTLAGGGLNVADATNNQYIALNKGGLEVGWNNNSNTNLWINNPDAYGLSNVTGTSGSGTVIAGINPNDDYFGLVQFQSKANWTDGRTTFFTPLVAQSGSIVTGSAIFTELTGSLGAFSASISTRINNVSGSGGTINTGSFITTGSVGQLQAIKGTLGVSDITTLSTGSTPSTINSSTGTLLNFLYDDINFAASPSIDKISAGWTMSGSGITNGIVTSAGYGDTGYEVNITSGNVVSGSSYIGTGPFVKGLIITGSVFSDSEIKTPAGFTISNQDGTGVPYGAITFNAAGLDPTDIDTSVYFDGGANLRRLQLGLSSYTAMYGGQTVPTIQGGGNYNAGFGSSNVSMTFFSSSIQNWKPTEFKAGITGSLNVTGTLNVSSAITSSTIRLTGTGTTAIQYNQPSTGSVNGVNATYYGKADFKIYQYNSQPYAFNAYLQTNQLLAYTGSEFQWGLETNGTNSIPGGGSTYFSLVSGSTINGSGAGATKVGLSYLQTAQYLDFKADSAFNRKVYINNGLMVSSSNGSSTASVIIDGSLVASQKALEVTGSVIITGSIQVNGDNLATTNTNTFTNTQIVSSSIYIAPNNNNNQLYLPSGSNRQTGLATLDGGNPGTVTISNTNVTANSIIMLTKQTNNHPNAGPVNVSSKGSGTFTITSNHNGDSDVVAFMIINPS